MSNMKITKIGQKYFPCAIWGFLVIIICDVKTDVNICESHYVNLFLWTSSIVHVYDFLTSFWQLFIIWHFDILLPYHLCAPLLMGTGVMGHMSNVAYPSSRSTWGQGNGNIKLPLGDLQGTLKWQNMSENCQFWQFSDTFLPLLGALEAP